jgi:hypothetical protein
MFQPERGDGRSGLAGEEAGSTESAKRDGQCGLTGEYRGWRYECVGLNSSGRPRYRFTLPDGRLMHMPCADQKEIEHFINAMIREMEDV